MQQRRKIGVLPKQDNIVALADYKAYLTELLALKKATEDFIMVIETTLRRIAVSGQETTEPIEKIDISDDDLAKLKYDLANYTVQLRYIEGKIPYIEYHIETYSNRVEQDKPFFEAETKEANEHFERVLAEAKEIDRNNFTPEFNDLMANYPYEEQEKNLNVELRNQFYMKIRNIVANYKKNKDKIGKQKEGLMNKHNQKPNPNMQKV